MMLVCAETFSWPMHYVAERIRPYCKDLSAVFIQPGEGYFNAPDYALFKSLNKDVHIFDMGSVAENYIRSLKAVKKNLDWEYIKKIENSYTAFSSLNEQLLTEMTLLPYYHDRKYYEYIDYNKILLYVQLYYQYIEELFKNNKPDVILDTDVDFFGRSVLLEISNKYNVPYISIDHARIDGYVLPTTSLVKKRNKQISYLFDKYVIDSSIMKDKNVSEMYDQTKRDVGDVPEIFKEMYVNHQFSIYSMMRQAAISTIVSIRYFSLKKIKLNILQGISSPISSSVFRSYQFMYMYYIRRFYLEYSNLFDKKDLTTVNYIYVPLHVIPESSTTVLSPYYINETFIIESLSKSVRPDQYILVKEHWSMIGYRPISYYKKIKRLPNVILIDPGGQYLPKDYIKNSDLVVTISGSAAMEASIMGVNSLVFSDVIYGMLSSVRKIHIDSNLRKIVAKHVAHKMPEQELYAYIKILLKYGRKVRIKNLLMPPARVNKVEKEQDTKNLLDVFVNGIKLYEKNKDFKSEI
ncbi:hypothetical protein N9505_07390 [Candidatus Thioglobus sp.]|nr:hypothetical protein [Candidatus Thioglobus sp.]